MRIIVPPILALICITMMVVLRWLLPIKMLIDSPWNLIGIVPMILGLAIGFSGVYQFRKAKTNIRPFKEADKIVTSGPFRFTRNPMYLGIVLLLFGIWILLGALSPAIGIVIFMVTADRWYIRVEEQMLRQKFGPEFEAYCTKVRRWI